MDPSPPSYDDAIAGDFSSRGDKKGSNTSPSATRQQKTPSAPPATGDLTTSVASSATGNQDTSNASPSVTGDQMTSDASHSTTGDQITSSASPSGTGNQMTSSASPSATGNQMPSSASPLITGASTPATGDLGTSDASCRASTPLLGNLNNRSRKALRLWIYFVVFLLVLAAVGIICGVLFSPDLTTTDSRPSSQNDCKYDPPYLTGGTWRQCPRNKRGQFSENTKCFFDCDDFHVLSSSVDQHKYIKYTCIGAEWFPSQDEILECIEYQDDTEDLRSGPEGPF